MTTAQIQALITAINDNGQNTALEARTVLTAIAEEAIKIGEIKMLAMSELDIANEFDSTGLAILKHIGFAICNGNNGTYDLTRKVPVGYDPTPFVSGFDYSVMGNSFGEEEHALTIPEMPIHSHSVPGTLAAGNSAGGSGTFGFGNSTSSFVGGNDSHNNMQPSVVVLFIQRIA